MDWVWGNWEARGEQNGRELGECDEWRWVGYGKDWGRVRSKGCWEMLRE